MNENWRTGGASKLVLLATTMPVGALDSNKPVTASWGWWSRQRVEHGKIAAPEPAKNYLDGQRVRYCLDLQSTVHIYKLPLFIILYSVIHPIHAFFFF